MSRLIEYAWRGRTARLREMMAMEMKRSSSKSCDWRGEKGAGILPKNSTLDMAEGEGDRGEGGGIGKNMGEDTRSYLEGKGNLSSNMGEICEEEGEGKTRGRFAILLLGPAIY